MATLPQERDFFLEGIALFNDGEFFEAHEIWEDAWHLASGPRKSFYQGLIQCAVTLEHVRRGNPRGVRSVWTTAQQKFAGLPSPYLGIDHVRLLAELRSFVQPVLDLPPGRFSPGLSRGQEMPVDLARAPRIELPPEDDAEGGSANR
jgi:predicted metal-dependent hydrolase